MAEPLLADTEEEVTIYLLERTGERPGPETVNRTHGMPIGVSKERWPRFDGKPMEHAITLDLESVPAIRDRVPAGTRAVALFVSDLMMNEAFGPDTPDTAVLFLTQAEVDRGVGEPPEGLEATDLDDLDEDEGPSTFRCHELTVPVEVFAGDELLDRDEDDPVVQLSYEIGNCVGGKPQWIQGEDHDGVLLFQFDEDIVEMNLGDAGLMYVFADTAFWQCS